MLDIGDVNMNDVKNTRISRLFSLSPLSNAFVIIFILSGAVLVLVGMVINGTGSIKIGDILIATGEFVSLVFALHFVYEKLTRSSEHIDFINELEKALSPQIADIKSFGEDLRELNSQTAPILNISRYSDNNVLKAKWEQIVNQSQILYLIGNFPLYIIEDIKEILKTGHRLSEKKTVSIFCSVGQRPKEEIIELLKISRGEESSDISIYHIDRLDWGF